MGHLSRSLRPYEPPVYFPAALWSREKTMDFRLRKKQLFTAEAAEDTEGNSGNSG